MTRRGISDHIFKRLDRALCSMDWRLMFMEGFVKHLPRVTSDHCRILLCLHSNHVSQKSLKPFRFEAMWLKHKNFGDLMKQYWSMSSESLKDKIFMFCNKLKDWNENIFNCIFQKKRRIIARLQEIQRSLEENFIPGLVKLEAKLQEEYELIVEQEEIFWLYKSRNSWLMEGDRNTRFFHLATMIGKRYNKLESLKGEDGIRKCDKDNIKDIATSDFLQLFSANPSLNGYDCLSYSFPTLSKQSYDVLPKDVNEEEVRNSLFGIGGLKAPSPDGLTALFFQNQWVTCTKDLVELVVNSFKSGCFPL
ncbi:hypothetical protein Ddye_013221 [Dipteronia dyeriana]|uniref:Reverse transcriptase n=1 Tax=Dipteronia dyeriana TaxID=168575 RepID=A0AAE0CJF6_9ROSI|nr:hypothetical protein Ddye_013221 [Dipteronia dyeriana]